MVFETVQKHSDVTLYRTGLLYISRHAVAKYFCASPFALVEYDPDTMTVALTPTNGKPSKHTWTLMETTRGTRTVSLKAVLKRYHVSLCQSIFADLEERDGRLCFQIPREAVKSGS